MEVEIGVGLGELIGDDAGHRVARRVIDAAALGRLPMTMVVTAIVSAERGEAEYDRPTMRPIAPRGAPQRMVSHGVALSPRSPFRGACRARP
jgi:hypothetical protein